jgi:uncharacterized protein
MQSGRKKHCRYIEKDFSEYFFKPRGTKLADIDTAVITKDELEALRLVDANHMSQAQAAETMNTSSSTIQRILEKTREKIINALINGYAIKIEGGTYKIRESHMPNGDKTGPKGKGCGTGRGLGKKAGNTSGKGRGKGCGKNKKHQHDKCGHDHDHHTKCHK